MVKKPTLSQNNTHSVMSVVLQCGDDIIGCNNYHTVDEEMI